VSWTGAVDLAAEGWNTMFSAERLRLDVADAGGVPWRHNQSCRNLAACAGDGDGDRHLVVVNLSGQPTQARIPLDWPDLPGRSWRLTDILGPSVFKRYGGELAIPGLFVDLGPWQFHLLALQ
jgi:hypothetical protein